MNVLNSTRPPNYMRVIFYLLKGTLYRTSTNPEDLIEIHVIFQNDNPIKARQRAFEVYQNYVDVLLQGIGADYEDHEMARNALKKFLEEKEKPSMLTDLMNKFREDDEALFKIENDFDKGISLYMVMADSKTFNTLESELIYEDKILIHDLNSELTGVREHINKSLIKEYLLYKENGFDSGDCEVEVGENVVLKTPVVFG